MVRGSHSSTEIRPFQNPAVLQVVSFPRLNWHNSFGGRFPESESLDFEYDFQYPVILDPKNKYDLLLINHYHHESGYNGVETVMNNLRLTYWILHIRQAVKKCFNAGLYCKIRECEPIAPQIGLFSQVSSESNVFPFTYLGIDFFGSMTISVGRKREKDMAFSLHA
ncbi:hypothetical protein JTB14_002440 [Gonioctena quinquepunctata]|nr:hypothetical protein JTB14_002440 [Gonioctena quinquepunctata]